MANQGLVAVKEGAGVHREVPDPLLLDGVKDPVGVFDILILWWFNKFRASPFLRLSAFA
jgi:hypothetical protein